MKKEKISILVSIDMEKLKNFDPNNLNGVNCFKDCITISTRHSLVGMIMPGVVVIFSPLAIGLLFGAEAVAGYLIGVIISGIQMATSSANTGGAWDNCKKSVNSKKN